MTSTVLDSGPLAAFYGRNDAWHRWAQDQMEALDPPLLTCESVLTEACCLLQLGVIAPPKRGPRLYS